MNDQMIVIRKRREDPLNTRREALKGIPVGGAFKICIKGGEES
jgi:hypothetical protein